VVGAGIGILAAHLAEFHLSHLRLMRGEPRPRAGFRLDREPEDIDTYRLYLSGNF
jgi:hypothetical protein